MSENYGDKLAREVSLRIGASVANEAALSTLPARQKTNGRIILARTESTLWQVVGNGASGVLVPLGTGGGVGLGAEHREPERDRRDQQGDHRQGPDPGHHEETRSVHRPL